MERWFEEEFGFAEASNWDAVTSAFDMGTAPTLDAAAGGLKGNAQAATLTPRAGPRAGVALHVGVFEMPTLADLREAVDNEDSPKPSELGGATFENVAGQVQTIIADPANAGAVFMVASQFNCLEMVGPGETPENGITQYFRDRTQGPACAMACPAGTLFRNYFVNGRGQRGGSARQLDNSGRVGALLQNEVNGYWKMRNGYLLPPTQDKMRELAERLRAEPQTAEHAQGEFAVGVHWETQVKRPRNGREPHHVCQVFASALPLQYGGAGRRAQDWEPLGRIVQHAAMESTLLVAALLASRRKVRVTVYLTALGCGAFGNPTDWFLAALHASMKKLAAHPLDVRLLHYGSLPAAGSRWTEMETTLRAQQESTKRVRASY